MYIFVYIIFIYIIRSLYLFNFTGLSVGLVRIYVLFTCHLIHSFIHMSHPLFITKLRHWYA